MRQEGTGDFDGLRKADDLLEEIAPRIVRSIVQSVAFTCLLIVLLGLSLSKLRGGSGCLNTELASISGALRV